MQIINGGTKGTDHTKVDIAVALLGCTANKVKVSKYNPFRRSQGFDVSDLIQEVEFVLVRLWAVDPCQ